jgi:hypothetical protein
MSIKSKVLAAAAAVTLIAGGGAAGALTTAGPASAATPSCGGSCINLYPKVYSQTSPTQPQFVADVFRQGEKVGQPVILFRTANFDPAEDFTLAFQGTVQSFWQSGLVSSAVALRYGCVVGTSQFEFPTCAPAAVNDDAFEIEYAPFGVDSGLCIGVAAAAFAGEKVTLQPCGVSSKTVWIQDTNPGDFPAAPYYAAINGSGALFSNPLVLNYPDNGYPTNIPRPQLELRNLGGFSASVANDNEMWTAKFGVLS